MQSVRDLLENHNNFDLNCQGMTDLNLAMEANCEKMVDLLLYSHGLEIGDSLMHAIRENQYFITVKLLDILQSENRKNV
jgi:hypothetical protein